MHSSSLSSCVCECGRLLLLLRVSLKRAFLENGPRWQETSQGGTLQVCMSQHVWGLAEEADTLIKSYLEPLLIVPSGVSSLTSYHTHNAVCTHYPMNPLKLHRGAFYLSLLSLCHHLVSPGTPSTDPVTPTSTSTSKSPPGHWWRCARWTERKSAGTTSPSSPWRWVRLYKHANKDTSGCNWVLFLLLLCHYSVVSI